jgi:tetratricopeptide (TPR) repeat protein
MGDGGKLAQAALPDAVFPLEIARLDTVMATAAYERGALDEARGLYQTGLAAWAYAGKGYHDETLYETALDRAADIAYRQGREDEAVALSKRYIEWVGDRDRAWSLTEGRAELKSARTGQALPLRVGDFRLKPIGQKLFQYEDLRTGERLGLSVEQKAGIGDEALERSMRAFMRDKLGLEAGGLQASAFAPRAQEGGTGQLQGRKWVFELAPRQEDGRTLRLDGRAEGGAPAPVGMVFWIVDRGDSRSILRAPLTADRDGNARIERVAQALAW